MRGARNVFSLFMKFGGPPKGGGGGGPDPQDPPLAKRHKEVWVGLNQGCESSLMKKSEIIQKLSLKIRIFNKITGKCAFFKDERLK